MEYTIRPVKENDLDTIVELCEQHAHYERADYDRGGKKERLHRALFSSTPALFCLVVIERQRIVGYASYTFDFSTWDAQRYLHLDCLYLTEETRGHGIGEALINRIQSIAREQDCVNIQWQTPVFNVRAISFYQRMGALGKEKIRFFLS